MCIAIYKPADKTISEEILKECYRSNSDGAGFMYVQNKSLYVEKGFFTFDDFYEAYKYHENKQVVLHFRIKTHGPVVAENCHPFNINKGLAFVHNGIISGFGSHDYSDTRAFNNEILKPLVSKWGNLSIFQPAIKSLLESRIGYSKLIFLDRHGNVNIFNESKGAWDDGIWYSNNSYKPYVYEPSDYISPNKQLSLVPNKLYSYDPQKYDVNHRTLEVGDFVSLIRPYWDDTTMKVFTKDYIFEIIGVGQDLTADMVSDNVNNKPEYLYGVPYNRFDYCSETELYRSYQDYPYNNAIISA
jgi:glutamine amidotransferase